MFTPEPKPNPADEVVVRSVDMGVLLLSDEYGAIRGESVFKYICLEQFKS